MNFSRIRQAVILMAVVLSGLIFIISYLIFRAYQERKQDFLISVNSALANAVYEFDRNKIQNQLLESRSAQELVGESIKSLSNDSSTGNSTQRSNYVSHIDEPSNYNSYGTDNFNDESTNLSQELQKNITRRKDIGSLKSIFKDLLKRYLISPEQNLDVAQLDSNITNELRKNSIYLKHDLAIFDDFSMRFIHKSTEDESTFLNSIYKIPLYYLNLNNSVIISLDFPDVGLYLLRQISLLLISSLLMIASIIGLFIYSIRTIFEQKKIGELKNDLINNIAHELKTPISTISLACQAMNDEDMMKIDSIRNKYIQMVIAENQRLNTLVESVLNATMLEQSNIPLKVGMVDIHMLLQYSIESFELQLKKKNFIVNQEFLAKNYVIEADEEQLLHVFFNLIDNAIKYCGVNNKNPYLTIRTQDEGGKLKIDFVDNGMGIEPNQQLLVFDKLYRVASGNLHNVKGYGLGLSFAKSVVERHGGRIELDSELNIGSTFTIKLPN